MQKQTEKEKRKVAKVRNMEFSKKLEKEIKDGNNPIITVIYFVETLNESPEGSKRDGIGKSGEQEIYEKGEYIKKTGVAVKINYTDMYLQVVDEKILLKNIYSIEGEIFGEYAI